MMADGVNRTLEVFEATAAAYDRDRARLIPEYESFYRWAVELIPARAKRILELGAGSGVLSAMVRSRMPGAELHLVDFSAAMLGRARERLAGSGGGEIFFHEADYVRAELPGENCAIVSALSIHHLEDEEKQTLLRRCYERLKPNGVFVNADQVAGPTAELEERYKAWWLEEVRALGATERQIEDSLYRQREDRCAAVEMQLGWMREAGFRNVDCWYKNGRFAVMAGVR